MQNSVQQALFNLTILESFQEIPDITFYKELNAYKKFYETFLSEYEQSETKDAKMLLNHMRACGIHKLFDEPEQYESMSIQILLDGILGKHLQDLVSLLELYNNSEPPIKEQLFLELHKAFLVLPKNSPCLDAYSTELDRLVRVYTEPLEDTSHIKGVTLTSHSFQYGDDLKKTVEYKSDFRKAQHALDCFTQALNKNGIATSECSVANFAFYLRVKEFYSNPKYGTLSIRNFQTVCNLLQAVYLFNDIHELFEIHQQTL